MNELNSIPKKIHYCWFGGKPLPAELKECVDSWKKLDGYEIVEWNESNCSFDENEFVRRTFAEKKLGFIGDYYRLKAVYEYGGIYLDTDVKVFKSFDKLLNNEAFINFIFDCSVGTAIIGSKPGNPFIKAMMDMYDATVFGKNEDGRVFNWIGNKLQVSGYATSNYYFTYYILNQYPQFKLNNKFQDMGDFVIYPKELFEIGSLLNKHYTIHYCAGVWRAKTEGKQNTKEKMKGILRKLPFLYNYIQIITRKIRYAKLKKGIPFYPCYIAQRKNMPMPKL